MKVKVYRTVQEGQETAVFLVSLVRRVMAAKVAVMLSTHKAMNLDSLKGHKDSHNLVGIEGDINSISRHNLRESLKIWLRVM